MLCSTCPSRRLTRLLQSAIREGCCPSGRLTRLLLSAIRVCSTCPSGRLSRLLLSATRGGCLPSGRLAVEIDESRVLVAVLTLFPSLQFDI